MKGEENGLRSRGCYNSFISKQQKKLLLIKRIINFAIADVSREDSFSRPVKFMPLY
jgi:hypothetical protein